VEIPWGAHPTEVLGYYNLDRTLYALFFLMDMREDSLKAWMDEWIYKCPDRQAYLDHYIASYGAGKLDAIRAKSYYSAPANYGAAFTSCWGPDNRERTMGVTQEEMEKILEERGLLYG